MESPPISPKSVRRTSLTSIKIVYDVRSTPTRRARTLVDPRPWALRLTVNERVRKVQSNKGYPHIGKPSSLGSLPSLDTERQNWVQTRTGSCPLAPVSGVITKLDSHRSDTNRVSAETVLYKRRPQGLGNTDPDDPVPDVPTEKPFSTPPGKFQHPKILTYALRWVKCRDSSRVSLSLNESQSVYKDSYLGVRSDRKTWGKVFRLQNQVLPGALRLYGPQSQTGPTFQCRRQTGVRTRDAVEEPPFDRNTRATGQYLFSVSRLICLLVPGGGTLGAPPPPSPPTPSLRHRTGSEWTLGS